MKPYGRVKNLQGRGPGKTDGHFRQKKEKGIVNWWEVMIDCISRSGLKQRVNKDILEQLLENGDGINNGKPSRDQ